MTPEERWDEISKQLFMNHPPDAWVMLTQELIVRHIRDAERLAYQAGLKAALDIASDYTGQGVSIAEAILRRLEESQA